MKTALSPPVPVSLPDDDDRRAALDLMQGILERGGMPPTQAASVTKELEMSHTRREAFASVLAEVDFLLPRPGFLIFLC